MTVALDFIETLEKTFIFLATVLVGLLTWVFRKIMTNERKIAVLEKDLENAQVVRRMDHESLKEVRDDVKTIKDILMDKGK